MKMIQFRAKLIIQPAAGYIETYSASSRLIAYLSVSQNFLVLVHKLAVRLQPASLLSSPLYSMSVYSLLIAPYYTFFKMHIGIWKNPNF